MCAKVASSVYFSSAVLFVVVLNGIIAALDTPDRGVEKYGTKPHIPKDVMKRVGKIKGVGNTKIQIRTIEK